jgi:hypothetical protein
MGQCGLYRKSGVLELLGRLEESRLAIREAIGSVIPARSPESDRTEKQALERANVIRRKIEQGVDFAEVAKVESDDQSTGIRGGALGTIRRGQMMSPLEEVLFALPDRVISQPIHTPYGYHVVQVVRHLSRPFSEVHQEIRAKLEREAIGKLSAEIAQRTSVFVDRTYFGREPGAQSCATCARTK